MQGHWCPPGTALKLSAPLHPTPGAISHRPTGGDGPDPGRTQPGAIASSDLLGTHLPTRRRSRR